MDAVVFEQFEDGAQQKQAYQVGTWIFLASEVMFFGGLVCAYVVYRFLYPAAFLAGSHHMNLAAGTLNTAVLLTSSLTMALAVHAQENGGRRVSLWLWLTCFLGLVFIGLKFYEYYGHYREHLVPGPGFDRGNQSAPFEMFFVLYFCMTGLHAIHLTIGCGLVGTLATMARRPLHTFPALGVDMVGLYWHFVDIVWIFLYPMLYLIGHRGG